MKYRISGIVLFLILISGGLKAQDMLKKVGDLPYSLEEGKSYPVEENVRRFITSKEYIIPKIIDQEQISVYNYLGEKVWSKSFSKPIASFSLARDTGIVLVQTDQPDGYSSEDDQTDIVFYNIETGESWRLVNFPYGGYSLSPSGKYMISTSQIYQTKTGRKLAFPYPSRDNVYAFMKEDKVAFLIETKKVIIDKQRRKELEEQKQQLQQRYKTRQQEIADKQSEANKENDREKYSSLNDSSKALTQKYMKQRRELAGHYHATSAAKTDKMLLIIYDMKQDDIVLQKNLNEDAGQSKYHFSNDYGMNALEVSKDDSRIVLRLVDGNPRNHKNANEVLIILNKEGNQIYKTKKYHTIRDFKFLSNDELIFTTSRSNGYIYRLLNINKKEYRWSGDGFIGAFKGDNSGPPFNGYIDLTCPVGDFIIAQNLDRNNLFSKRETYYPAYLLNMQNGKKAHFEGDHINTEGNMLVGIKENKLVFYNPYKDTVQFSTLVEQ